MRLKLSSVWSLVRISLAGGAGIVVARWSGNMYEQHVKPSVIGASPDKTRAILDDVLKVVAMAGGTLLADRIMKHVPMVRPAERIAFKFGGLAESGRVALGKVLRNIKPEWNFSALSGSDPFVASGYQMGDPGSGYYAQLSAGNMGDVEDWESFAGVEDIDSFDGPGGKGVRGVARQSLHPFASAY